MAGIRLEGNTSGNVAEVTSGNRLQVSLPDGGAPADVGAVRLFSENDAGTVTGSPQLYSPETDEDYRLRVSQDCILDTETFNYTAQNTGKHSYANATMTITWSAAGLTTNASNITTTTTGVAFASYAEFPMLGTTELYCEIEGSFSAQPVANASIDFGLFRRGASNPYAPTDGVYFRLTSSGLYGVINSNGSETTTAVMAFTYVPGRVYQFTISCHERETRFWIDDVLYGSITTPVGNGQPFTSATLPFGLRQAHVGAAGGVINFAVRDYTISIGGSGFTTIPSTAGNRLLGSYQGLSGGTMGGLATYVNSTNPTAAAPSNTALTANLPGGLGGQGAVTAAAAAATDGIWASYQVPAGTVAIPGKRLVLRGVMLDAVNIGAAVATTATTVQFAFAFGHTAASLATAEAVAAKAPRRIPLGFMSWAVGAAIGQGPQSGRLFLDLGDAPAFVNPGEFIAIVGKFLVGTATASQVIQFTWTPIYGWE
jgi:hypothetical protein